MGRDPRYLPQPGALVEVTVRTFQERYLLRPGRHLNRIVVGVLAHAQRATGLSVQAFVVMSNHLHLLVSPCSTRQLAEFMCRVNCNLSKEVGRLHKWSGPMFSRRYTSIPVSDEPQAQIARLRYLLAQGCKENLVARPTDWPGVHSSRAMIEGRPVPGTWVDRTALYRALRRGKSWSEADFRRDVELVLDPIPCWGHLDPETYQSLVAEIVESIETEARARHRAEGTSPRGAAWVCRRHPHERPQSPHRSPKPRFHAFARRVRDQLIAAFRAFLAVYRDAADRLAAGVSSVAFPANCYPPRLPFVEPDQLDSG